MKQIVDRNGVGRVKCPTCPGQFQPRNIIRHRTACARRRRKSPVLKHYGTGVYYYHDPACRPGNDYRIERRDGGHAYGIWWSLILPSGKTEEHDTLREAREAIADYIEEARS